MRKLPLPALAAAAFLVAALATGACIPTDNAPGSPGPATGGAPTTTPPPATPPPAPQPGPAPAPGYTPPPPAPTPAPPGPGPAPVPPAPVPPVGGVNPPPPPPIGPDPRPEPPEPPPIDDVVYLIVGNDQVLGAGDQELSDLLDDLEFSATVLDDAENAREAFDANLIIISESVNANTINGEYRNEEVPILVMQSAIYEDMRMIGANDDVRVNANEVEVEDENHPIAEAVNILEGDLAEISAQNSQLGFAQAGEDAEIVLTRENDANDAFLFTYEEGDEMDVDQDAPERRVALGIPENILDNLAADGDDILEACILYAWSGDAEEEPGRRR